VNSLDSFIDSQVKSNIDFQYILGKIEVNTPYGKKAKESMRAFLPGEEDLLREELDRIDTIISLINQDRPLFLKLKSIFSHIKDLSNSISRAIEGHLLTVVELFEIKGFILILGELEESLNILSWDLPGDIKIERIKKLEELLDPHGQELKTFYIYDEYSEELTLIRKEKRSLEKRIKEERRKLKDKIKEELKVSIRPDDSILISKNEVELLDKLKASPYLAYSSETYMNIKYSIIATALIDELEKEMESLKAREDREEFKIRTCLSLEIASESKEIFRNMEAIGKLDLTIGKAYMAINIKGVKPKISENHIVDIVEGRHLKVEDTLRKRNQQFTPISVSLREGVTCITGANMGGKTVSLRMIGQIASAASYGMFVPCEYAKLCLFEHIHISVGDDQSIEKGLSTSLSFATLS